jgi:alanine racemase
MARPTLATIHLAALQHNYRRVKQLAPNARVWAMVKANAYGHGIVRVANALKDLTDGFGVASIDEALQLRAAGFHQPVLLLEGPFCQQELAEAVEQQFDLVIHQQQQIEWLTAQPLAKPLSVWLKLDTGMHRLGFTLQQAVEACQHLQQSANVSQLNAMTHFSCAEEVARDVTEQQLIAFNRLIKQRQFAACSLANSAAILHWPATHGDWVRPGIMLYGSSSTTQQLAADYQLRPVMTLSSRIIAIRDLAAGESVGYGQNWTCQRPSRIGTIAIGYGDGYPRHAKAGTPVLIKGQHVPLVGRVSMDMLTVDLTDYPQVQLGDSAVLWGEQLPAEIVAHWADTISYELFCGLTPRVAIKGVLHESTD